MIKIDTAINVGIFGGITSFVGCFGYQVQKIMEVQNRSPGWTPTIIGVAAGAASGAIISGLLWSVGYNPMPRVYRDMTTNTYRVIKRYVSGTGDYLVVRVTGKIDNRQAVLKMPRLDLLQDIGCVTDKLARTYRLLSVIDSPHVVRPLGFFKGYKYFVLVLEHVEGLTLEESRKQCGYLNFFQTLEFAVAVAKGLREFHAKGTRFGHEIDYSYNIILHPERKAVLIDPPEGVEASRGPHDEMDIWAEIVRSAYGQNIRSDILEMSASDPTATPEKVQRLQTTLNRASGMPGFERHANYDELIGELEGLLQEANE